MKNIIHRSRFKEIEISNNPNRTILEKNSAPEKKHLFRLPKLKLEESNDERIPVNISHRTVGDRLSYLRRRAGLTQKEISDISAISRAELCRLEKGTRRITHTHIIKLAAAYKISYRSLKDIIEYKPDSKVQIIQLSDNGVDEKEYLPCFLISSLNNGSNKPRTQILAPRGLKLSKSAYALEIDHASDERSILNGSTVILDPRAKINLGDLVFKPSANKVAFFRIKRGHKSKISGRFDQTNLTSMGHTHGPHKVIVIFPTKEAICESQ